MNEYRRLFDYSNLTLEIGGIEDKCRTEEDNVAYISFRLKSSDKEFSALKTSLLSDLILSGIRYDLIFQEEDTLTESYRLCDEDNAFFKIFDENGVRKLILYSRNRSRDLGYNLKNCFFLVNTVFSDFLKESKLFTDDLGEFANPSGHSIDDLVYGKRKTDLAAFTRTPSKRFVLTEYGLYPNPGLSEDEFEYISRKFSTKMEFNYSDSIYINKGINAKLSVRKEYSLDDPMDSSEVFSDLQLSFSFDGKDDYLARSKALIDFSDNSGMIYLKEDRPDSVYFMFPALDIAVTFENNSYDSISGYYQTEKVNETRIIVTGTEKNLSLKENADDFYISVFKLSGFFNRFGINPDSLRTALGEFDIDENPSYGFASYGIWDIPKY